MSVCVCVCFGSVCQVSNVVQLPHYLLITFVLYKPRFWFTFSNSWFVVLFVLLLYVIAFACLQPLIWFFGYCIYVDIFMHKSQAQQYYVKSCFQICNYSRLQWHTTDNRHESNVIYVDTAAGKVLVPWSGSWYVGWTYFRFSPNDVKQEEITCNECNTADLFCGWISSWLQLHYSLITVN